MNKWKHQNATSRREDSVIISWITRNNQQEHKQCINEGADNRIGKKCAEININRMDANFKDWARLTKVGIRSRERTSCKGKQERLRNLHTIEIGLSKERLCDNLLSSFLLWPWYNDDWNSSGNSQKQKKSITIY